MPILHSNNNHFQPTVVIQRSAIVIICRLSLVCDASVLWRIMQFSLKCSNFSPAKFDDNIRRSLSIWGLKVGWGGFRLRDAVYRKRCKIELSWQLITNRKSWAFACNKSRWPWMILNKGATVGYCQLSWIFVHILGIVTSMRLQFAIPVIRRYNLLMLCTPQHSPETSITNRTKRIR